MGIRAHSRPSKLNPYWISILATGLFLSIPSSFGVAGDCIAPLLKALKSSAPARVSASRAVLSSVKVERLTAPKITQLIKTILESEDPALVTRARTQFERAVREGRKARSAALKELDAASEASWPKDGVEYMFYPDQFGSAGKTGTFHTAAEMVPYLKKLGVDTLYPLPFLKSAGLDGGFDVISFTQINPKLGGNAAFEAFLAAAKKHNMKVKMDLILNHVSDQHEWFQGLVRGDPKYRKYFITRDKPPEIIRRYESEQGKVVVYRELDARGKSVEVHRRLIFPDIADSHYREITMANGKKIWVYHTFYPFQLDLNYANPDVLAEGYQILGHWANKGVDVFRLDAIPFIDKTAENHVRTHTVVEFMSSYLKQVAPHSRLMVEACQPLDDIVKYFGREMKMKVSMGARGARVIDTPSESQMAYQFKGMNNKWLSIESRSKKHYYDYMSELKRLEARGEVPSNAIWAQILRVHDELTLEMVPDAQKPIMQKLIADGRGASFREGNGVAGRAANFLGNDKDRIRLAYSMLMSEDGMPVIYYGDEIAAQNNAAFVVSEDAARKQYFQQAKIKVLGTKDARDLGRGPLSKDAFVAAAEGRASELSNETFTNLQAMIAARKQSVAMRRGKTEMLANNRNDVISFFRSHKESGQRVLVVHNLGESVKAIQIETGDALGSGSIQVNDLLTGRTRTLRAENGKVSVTLGRYESVWLTPSKPSK